MPVAPDPSEIYNRAVEEGDRRLEQSTLELVSTGFIAGFTVVFGIVALGIVEGLVGPHNADLAKIAGALAFGPGVVFLVVGRAELFNENFFDPVARAIEESGSWMLRPLVRLWIVTLVFNLVGGALMVLIFSVDGALPSEAGHAFRTAAEEIVHRGAPAEFADSFAGGVLVTLLSFLLSAVNGVGSRITLSYLVGFLLALGPFDHVVVTGLHVLFGVLFGAEVGVSAVAVTIAVVTVGNLAGGLGLVTLTHVAQARGARESGG
ncbi:formate/nitrite transporter family protein [Halorarum halophilum]|uniref:Formate/nitrite transporter family protein n=1 Tax=Halorarum halophilum TaxID=2743090 RepID=A0A7D5GXW0_9EURY|nr:formate/nitrite transporter family protein [Halobaculum halophilum]QLG26453.1 formate/nitrite transporter family protein [Halobaculum halophilum]